MSAAPTPPPQRSSIRPFKFGWQTGTFRRGLWLASWVGWTIYFLLPLLSGWFLKLAFDALATDQSVTGLLVSIGVVEVVRWAVFAVSIWVVAADLERQRFHPALAKPSLAFIKTPAMASYGLTAGLMDWRASRTPPAH
jgi:uncharacterized membrane protein (DUF485 family)